MSGTNENCSNEPPCAFIPIGVDATGNRKISQYVDESLMFITALSPIIGYQNAAHIAEDALAEGSTLREAATASGHVSAQQFDDAVQPLAMVGQGVAGA